MLAAEKSALMPGAGCWPVIAAVKPPAITPFCLDPDLAEREFLIMAGMLGLPGAGA
jgi:hypothetical protein